MGWVGLAGGEDVEGTGTWVQVFIILLPTPYSDEPYLHRIPNSTSLRGKGNLNSWLQAWLYSGFQMFEIELCLFIFSFCLCLA